MASRSKLFWLVSSCLYVFVFLFQSSAQTSSSYVLRPARVFDGEASHDGWIVVVSGDKIQAAGPVSSVKVPPDARPIDLPNLTLMPGLIDAHSHVLLHPYSETLW